MTDGKVAKWGFCFGAKRAQHECTRPEQGLSRQAHQIFHGAFGLRWQAERDTAFDRSGACESGVALRLPPQSKRRLGKSGACAEVRPRDGPAGELSRDLPPSHR